MQLRASNYFVRWLAALALLAVPLSVRAGKVDEIKIIPEKFVLTGPAAQQRLLVEKWSAKNFRGQAGGDIHFQSSDPAVLQVTNGIAIPVSDGTAKITAIVGGKTAVAEVTVQGMRRPFEWSFRNHVQPVLAKAGCSSGACHGAASGQNGFKLSLRGYDNEGDFLALTHQALGRRVTLGDPGRSLVLLKPTGAVPHKGGKRFEVDSIDYKVMSEWIADGAPGPKPSDARIQNVEILPRQVLLEPGASQQLLVRATFSDGHTEDVTHWTKFNSANGTVAQVDDEGLVKVIGHGEGGITAWYLSRIAVATVTSPYTNNIPPREFTRAPRRNFIDDLVLEKLRDLNIPPSPRCSDAEFLRRAFIDTAGILPTEAETRAFLARNSAKKRDELIESLLQRPEFVDYWSYKWSDLLLVNDKKLRPAAVWAYYDWIRSQVAANTPWDKFVHQIITAQGSTLQNGAANFYILHDDPRALSETTCQAFLGMSVACAKCHNHPMEKWTNDQYYQMANLFARVRIKGGGQDGENIVFNATQGDLVQPLRGQPQPPTPLDGEPLKLDSPEDRRVPLADWLVSKENPYFSRAIVNRVWANFFGVGLVEGVDDIRASNPASNEKLFSAAAQFLVDHHFDLKALMRTILQSETYQRSSQAVPGNEADTRFYARYYPRRMMAEVLLDAVAEVTDVPTPFPRAGGGEFPAGWRAMQLPDVSADSYFLATFGRPERNITCECERSADPSMTQVLDLSNGETVNNKLKSKDCCLERYLATNAPPAQIVEHAYLRAFSRYPTRQEEGRLLAVIDRTDPRERRTALQDMYWAVLSSKEFLFNH